MHDDEVLKARTIVRLIIEFKTRFTNKRYLEHKPDGSVVREEDHCMLLESEVPTRGWAKQLCRPLLEAPSILFAHHIPLNLPINEHASRESNRSAEHNEQPNGEAFPSNSGWVVTDELPFTLASIDHIFVELIHSERIGIGLFNFPEHPGYDIHVDQNQNDAYYYPPTPYHALTPISLAPDRRLPALSPVLTGDAVYRPFPTTSSRQNNVPVIVERSRIRVFLFAIRLSGHTGDVRMLTLSNEGAAVSVNDVLEAVRAAIAGRQPAFAPAAAMAQMGTIRLDERGRLVWSGFRDGSEGVWELSLV
ncbi:hypothetical protein BDQ12DRAFT_665496 [Crucibulum laeve]|uniref:Uncharacterized protein n=1 Tax=Crucibulum laeve TaxID=68775 RepID=A0A5C3M5M9_9AGAR|nr:hypothetical protein BDQ12DRAFT_665496 [Crucibulum laeve]